MKTDFITVIDDRSDGLFFGEIAPVSLGHLLDMVPKILTLSDGNMLKISLPQMLIAHLHFVMVLFGLCQNERIHIDHLSQLPCLFIIINAKITLFIKNQPALV